MKRHKGKITALLFLALVIAGGVLVHGHRGAPAAAPDAQPSVLVTLTKLQSGSLPRIVTSYGNVVPAATASRTLTAPIQVQVMDVYRRAGSLAARASPLLRLAPTSASLLAYSQAQATLNLDMAVLTHTQALLSEHLATVTQVMQARTDEENAAASLQALKAQGADGPRIIGAPFDALVSSVPVAAGAVVAAGDPLVTLVHPDELELQASVPSDVAALVRPGDPARLTPNGGGAALVGTVTFSAAFVDPATGRVAVAIALSASDALMGEIFRADITVAQVNGYLIPHDALLVGTSGDTYVMQAHDLTAKQVIVQVLGSDGEQDVVAGPFEAGAPVIVSGAYQLNDGDSIRTANPPGAGGQ